MYACTVHVQVSAAVCTFTSSTLWWCCWYGFPSGVCCHGNNPRNGLQLVIFLQLSPQLGDAALREQQLEREKGRERRRGKGRERRRGKGRERRRGKGRERRREKGRERRRGKGRERRRGKGREEW